MILQDLRFAVRRLWIAPGYSLAVIVTLALGIGANTAVFSLLDGFLLRKLPYPEPEKIAALVAHREGVSQKTGKLDSDEEDSFQGSEWQTLRQNVDALTFASWGGTSGVNLQSASGAVRYLMGSRVSAGYFDVLGIRMQLGRPFTEDEDRPNGPAVAVLSDELWRSTFRGDRQIVGKAIRLKGEPYTVVGVLPPNTLMPRKAAVFTPLRPSPNGECGGTNCGIFVRLKPGATWQQAASELSHIRLPRLDQFDRNAHGRSWIYAKPLQTMLAAGQHDSILVLMVAVGFILLIACANLASLSLVRMARRLQEIATRLALGASGWAVVRQLWIETLLLALTGAGAGVALAYFIVNALSNFLPEEMIPMGGLGVNLHALTFTFITAVVTSILFGALPALQAWRLDLRSAIVSGGRSVTGASGGLRQWLIGAEVALTIVLLAAAGLMIRTLVHLETQPPGFDPHNVMTAKASLDDARYHNPAALQALLEKSVGSMQQSLGTNDVAIGLSLPYERGLNDEVTLMDGQRAGAHDGSSLAYVTSGYFSTLKMPLLAGRSFNESDTSSSEPVTVVNQDFARRILRDSSPLGRHIRLEGKTYAVVGVVENVAKSPGLEQGAPIATEPVFYVPAGQMSQGLVNVAHMWYQPSWIVRARNSDKAVIVRRMQEALAKVAPDLPFSGFQSMSQILAEQLQQQRIEVALLGTLSGLALLLSTVGIYALVSNLVVQRRREIGIRMVLGSSIGQAMLDIGSTGAIATLAGMVAGVALSFVALRVLESQIYGVQVYDPVTLVTVPVLLALIAGVAILLPTLRITRLQPAETLRAE